MIISLTLIPQIVKADPIISWYFRYGYNGLIAMTSYVYRISENLTYVDIYGIKISVGATSILTSFNLV